MYAKWWDSLSYETQKMLWPWFIVFYTAATIVAVAALARVGWELAGVVF